MMLWYPGGGGVNANSKGKAPNPCTDRLGAILGVVNMFPEKVSASREGEISGFYL